MKMAVIFKQTFISGNVPTGCKIYIVTTSIALEMAISDPEYKHYSAGEVFICFEAT
jgi:hypothetical protein